MRIAIYLRDLRGGGVERSMLNLARGLMSYGHTVDILVEYANGEFVDQVPPRCKVVTIQPSSHIHGVHASIVQANKSRSFLCLKSIHVILKKLVNRAKFLLTSFNAYLGIGHCLFLAARAKAPFATLRLCILYLSKSPHPKECTTIVRFLIEYIQSSSPSAIITGLEQQNFRLILASLLSSSETIFLPSVRNHLSSFWELYDYTPFHRWGIENLYGYSHGIVCVSHLIKHDLVTHFRLLPSKCRVIYNPVVSDNLPDLCEEDTDDDDWLDSRVPVILAAGRLHHQKGFDDLLKSFALVIACVPARLIVLGNGPESQSLANLALSLGISDSIRLPGFKMNPFSYMRKASVFVLSSRNEGLPGVIIQALACGCRIISTDCPSGPREILQGGKWGKLVPVGDINAMAKSILETLSEDHEAQSPSPRAKDFTVSNSTTEYLRVIEALSASRDKHSYPI